ncbi:MAG: ThuA domain-containing protein [Armatimonadetes bacterium]|jgi:type 1 glutamine amidotransferase|nr:ThuA domain-containing protein [Armatimonadota bacterium]
MSRLHRRSLTLITLVTLALGATLLAPPTTARNAKKKLLVVTVTKGFRHADSIPVAEKVIAELGAKSGKFDVDYVRTDEEMAQKMTVASLKNYDGVFFASTTGELPLPDKEGFLAWIKSGKGFCGAHAAADTFHNFPGYIEMIGGEFQTHGPQVEVEGLLEDDNHAATKPFNKQSFKVFDEIYIYKSYDWAKTHALIGMDKHPNTKAPGYYPLSWVKEYGKGHVFYTSLGHRVDVWQKPWYQEHVLGGILWSLKEAKGSAKLPKPGATPAVLKSK